MEQFEMCTNLNLDGVSEEWVNSIWMDNFLVFSEPPDEYVYFLRNEDINLFLKETCLMIRNWLNQASDHPDSDISWNTLKAKNINSRKLLAVLGYIIKTGQQFGVSEDSRQSCLRGTSLYLTLLSVPGSNVYEIFHPNLFHLAINTFKLLEYLIPVYEKPNRNMDIEDLYDIDHDPRMSLTQQEKLTLTQGLNSIMYDTINTLNNFNLKDHERSLEILVNSLVEIAKAETNINPLTTNIKPSKACLASLSYNAYIALKVLCQPSHGSVEVTIQLILKYVFQHLLMNHAELPTKNSNFLKDTVVKFLKILQESYEKEAELGFTILVQKLIVKCPERLEARQKQAFIVAKIINLFRGISFRNIIKNLILFSQSVKVNQRLCVLEITSKLLIEIADETDLSEENLSLRARVRKILLAIVLWKCKDSSNNARGKAMAIFTEITDETNKYLYEEEFREMFDSGNNNGLPCMEELQLALENNTNPLTGLNSILRMLFLRVEDDRAMIRRSALQSLKNVTYFVPNAIDKVIPLIGCHCRDLSMAVRKFAIQMLTQMLHDSPGNDGLLEEWVKSVVPQIFDIETKVQEKVLEAMDQLILKNLKIWNGKVGDDSAEFPWKIIDKLINLEMRKFLMKACTLWVENGTVDNSYVTRVRTHVGTVHEVQAWVLLATFSENFMLSNIGMYFSNYSELIKSSKYHVKFMLEVLRNSWSKVDKELLQGIQSQFYQSLCQFEVSYKYISVCIDILQRIYNHCQPNGEVMAHDLQANMLTLMKSAEAKIDRIFNEEGSIDVCPLRVMCTLGKAAPLCTGKVSSSTLNILQGMLLDWESVPLSLQGRTVLRQFGVQLLGELGLRDRDVAEQVTPILSCLMCQASEGQSLSETIIRINSAKVLADLCERFTALVEPFLPDMCICMKDPNPRVREAIVVIFIQLLLEDFIKVKGLLFFHILTMISDPDETIRELTVCLIKERLIVKNKALIYQQFIRSIFHYNDCTAHKKVGKFKMTDKEKAVLMLSGMRNESKRRCIYEFMLEHVDPLGKVKLIEGLTKSVLNGFCDDTLTMDGENERCLLKDTIYILSCDYIQPNFNTNKQNDDELQEEGMTPTNVQNNVINCLMESSKTFKLQQLMPMLLKLEAKLKDSKSSIVTDVRRFFIQLVLEYSKEHFLTLINEYPELEDRIESIRKNGKRKLNDDISDDEETREDKITNLKKKFKLVDASVVLTRVTIDKSASDLQESPVAANNLKGFETNDYTSKDSANTFTLTNTPSVSKRTKMVRSRSSSMSSVIASSSSFSVDELNTSTPIQINNKKRSRKPKECTRKICKRILNISPEITDDDSDDSDSLI